MTATPAPVPAAGAHQPMAQTADTPTEPPPAAEASSAPALADAAPRSRRRAWSRLAENWLVTVLAGLLAVAATVAATLLVLAFNGQSDRIAGVEDGIIRLEDKMDAGFADVDADIDRLEDKMDARFAAQDAKIDRLEDKMDARFAAQDAKFERLDEQFDEISVMLAALIAGLGKEDAVEAATAPN